MNANATENRDNPSPSQEQPADKVRRLVPDVDIYEKDGTVVLIADMPGVSGNSVDLNMEANKLSLVGSVAATGEGSVRTEFHRRFTLANDVDRDAVTATMNHGVLRVELPRREKASLKKINVTNA